MFSRSQRISSSLLQDILSKGRVSSSPHFSVVIVKNISQGPKIAVLVSKKVAHSAVYRNKLRRQARSKIKSFLEEKKITPNVGMIILVHMGWHGSFPTTFEEEIQKLLLKTKVVV